MKMIFSANFDPKAGNFSVNLRENESINSKSSYLDSD